MLFTIASEVGGYLARRNQARTSAAWDRYNNTMTGLQAAQAQNTITKNVALNREQHAENNLLIKTSRLIAAAKVKAGAAAAGVTGGSVASTLFDVGRNAGRATYKEDTRFATSLLASDQQRRSVSMQASMAQKPVTQSPSALSALATMGLNILGDETDTPTSSGTNLNGATPTANSGFEQLRSMLMI